MLGCGLRRGHPSVTAACTVIDVAVRLEAGDGGSGLPVQLSIKRGLSKLSIQRRRSIKCLEAGLSAWGGWSGGGGGGAFSSFWSKMYSRGKTSTCVGGHPASNMDGCISISPFHQSEASRAQAADDYPGTKKDQTITDQTKPTCTNLNQWPPPPIKTNVHHMRIRGEGIPRAFCTLPYTNGHHRPRSTPPTVEREPTLSNT